MFWKTLIGGAVVIGAALLLTLPAASGTGQAEAFDPVIDAATCLPGDRGRTALKMYLAAAQRKTEIGPFDRQSVAPAAGADDADAPLIEGLGKRRYRITASSPLVQRYFDQGLALAYGFNHAAARSAVALRRAVFTPRPVTCPRSYRARIFAGPSAHPLAFVRAC